MKIIKTPFYLLYKLYYLLVFSSLFLILLPFFLIGFYLVKNDKYIYFIHRVWAKCLNILTFIKLDLKPGGANLPQGPFVIISNHTSFLDVFLMCLILPHTPLVFMAKAELMNIPLFGLLFKHYHIPVFRKNRKKAAQSLIKSEECIEKGLSVVIFPEGGIYDIAPKLASFKNGAFKMAKDKQIPILPITFLNNFKLIGEPSELMSVARPGIAHAVIHPLVLVDEVNELSVTELKDKCYQIIEAPLKEKYKF